MGKSRQRRLRLPMGSSFAIEPIRLLGFFFLGKNKREKKIPCYWPGSFDDFVFPFDVTRLVPEMFQTTKLSLGVAAYSGLFWRGIRRGWDIFPNFISAERSENTALGRMKAARCKS